VEAPALDQCPKANWSPYGGQRHSWKNNDEKLWRVMVTGGTKYNKGDCKEGFTYGVDRSGAWATFCLHYEINPRAIKNAYITELKDLQEVIWYLKPENNVAYA
jgi:hypothetical protein